MSGGGTSKIDQRRSQPSWKRLSVSISPRWRVRRTEPVDGQHAGTLPAAWLHLWLREEPVGLAVNTVIWCPRQDSNLRHTV